MIDPAGIPQISGDMGALTQHAAALSQLGTAFADTGGRVHGTWQSLAPFYIAPEAEQLFAATAPIPPITASVGEDLRSVGSALSGYAAEVTGIQTRLRALHGQALEFVAFAAANPDWLGNEADVDRHNQLLAAVNAAVADFQDAERRCANRILALYTDRRHVVDNGDGVLEGDEYGFSAETLGALGEAGALPWGSGEQHDRGFWGDVGAFWGGVGEGAWEAATGLGALGGLSEDGFSWETAGNAWSGLGLFALAAFPPTGLVNSQTDLFGIPKGQLQEVLTAAGEGLIAYDLWGVDNARAAGKTAFNLVSAIVGTKGAGAGLRVTSTAAAASRIAPIATAGGAAVRVLEAVGRLPSASDLAAGALARFPGLAIPAIDLPDLDLPPTHVDLPRIDPPPLPPAGPSIADALPPTRPDDGSAVGAPQDPPVRPDGVGALSGPQEPPVRPDGGVGSLSASQEPPPLRPDNGVTTEAADAPPVREPVRELVPAGRGAAEPPIARPTGADAGFGDGAGRDEYSPEGHAPEGPTASGDRPGGDGSTPGTERRADIGPGSGVSRENPPTGHGPTGDSTGGNGPVGDDTRGDSLLPEERPGGADGRVGDDGNASSADDSPDAAVPGESMPGGRSTDLSDLDVPQGIDPEAFERASELVHEGAGHISDDIAVHGSRADGTAGPNSDIDIAVRVDRAQFEEMVRERLGYPNPGSAKERTMEYALNEGKLTSGRAGLRSLRKELEAVLGVKVDLSVILRDGPFDQGPYIYFGG